MIPHRLWCGAGDQPLTQFYWATEHINPDRKSFSSATNCIFISGLYCNSLLCSDLLLLRDDALELRLELLVRPLEEVDLLAVVLLVGHLLLRRTLLDHLARPLQVRHFLRFRERLPGCQQFNFYINSITVLIGYYLTTPLNNNPDASQVLANFTECLKNTLTL